MTTVTPNAMSGCLRARRDVTITPSGEGWVVKDPLTLEYFRLGGREAFLFRQLAEPLTVSELTRRYRKAFPNERGTGQQVMAFCSAMRDCALLLTDTTDRARDRKKTTQGAWSGVAGLLSPLAIRLPGVDPTPVLNATAWLGRLLLSRGCAVIVTLVALVVGMLLLGRVEEVLAELGKLTRLYEPQYATAAILAVMITKTWHEFGHALACRRLGAECHEIGVMLLAFMPCLYCDVSDAWTLPSRWRRAAVALAGVYFEFLLAVLALGLWLLLEPGPMRVLSLSIVVVASVSTLLINLNPLLRFDGYYVLADLWGVSNLHQVSRATLWGPITRWIRQDRTPRDPPEASPLLLSTYGAASTVYGWTILVVILWFAYQGLDTIGLAAAGDALLVLTGLGILFSAVRSAATLIPQRAGGMSIGSLGRLAAAFALGGIALAAIARHEIEQSLHAPCRLECAEFVDVVATVDGLLTPRSTYGEVVQAGETIAELDDPVAEFRLLELQGRAATLAAEIDGLRTRSQLAPELMSEIATRRAVLAEVTRQIGSHRIETERRRVTTPIGGRLQRPAVKPDRIDTEATDGDLPTWTGTPLDEANEGSLIQAGETLGRVAGGGVRAIVLLSQNDSGLLRAGDRARLLLDRETTRPLDGVVESISLATADGHLAEADRDVEQSLRGSLERDAAYRVTVRLDSPTKACQPGAIGQARLVTGRETVGGWSLRWLHRLFRLG